MPISINTIEPTISYFHEIIRTIIKIKVGILCIKNPKSISLIESPGSNTSKENENKNKINRIDKILGLQHKYLFTMDNEYSENL